jgi:hypothetical protein
MSNFDGATIEIINWDKYNPKRAQVTYTWLRLDNNIATDRSLFGLDPEQRYAWIVILCEVSRNNDPRYELNLPFLEHLTQVSQKKLTLLLQFLEKKGVIRSLHHTTPECSDPPPPTTPTNERTNERRCSNESIVFDFEPIWKQYPRKVNKTEGRERFERLIKSELDYQFLKKAVQNYTAYCAKHHIDEPGIRHFSSFLGTEGKESWRDWMEHGGEQKNATFTFAESTGEAAHA